jgi:hypothetical protein
MHRNNTGGSSLSTDQSNSLFPVLQDIFNIEELLSQAQYSEVKDILGFTSELRNAQLDNSGLDSNTLSRLRNPPRKPLEITDPDIRLSLDLYLALEHSSEKTYDSVRGAISRRYPSSSLLSFGQIQKLVSEMSGTTEIINDMCVNTCIAYTGPFKDLEACHKCSEPRFDQKVLSESGGQIKVARRKFNTIPLGPQLQAGWRDPTGAHNMKYRSHCTARILQGIQIPSGFDDYIHGSDYLDAVKTGKIKDDDIVLMFSIDGAQLYESKASDCWIYIWVILNYSPDLRYKKRYVLPGAFIPGPNKPKHIESFLFPGLYHLAALQTEGLQIWDAERDVQVTSYPFLLMATADGPAMAQLSGLVGHHGKSGCRLYCGTPGRHKPHGTHYYPALFKPLDFEVEGSNHAHIQLCDIKGCNLEIYSNNLRQVISSVGESNYRRNRLETGIARPSIFMGLLEARTLSVPKCFPIDIMHLVSLNITDLLLGLWRGTIDCDKHDTTEDWDWAVLRGVNWERHGAEVAATKHYLPTSFDRAPRNPSEKINSSYKAWEYLNYVFGVGPGVFLFLLPRVYYQHFCKLVKGIRIIQQHKISFDQLRVAHETLLEFVRDYEFMYYRLNKYRLHFVRQSIHALLHLAPETIRLGPLSICSQWPMERTIGNLGEEIKQHSSPYANLARRGFRRCCVNSLKSMVPDLCVDQKSPFPSTARDLQDGFVLLHPRDRSQYQLSANELNALKEYDVSSFTSGSNPFAIFSTISSLKVLRWARLHLPVGQVAHCAWKEATNETARISRMVKVQFNYFCSLNTI